MRTRDEAINRAIDKLSDLTKEDFHGYRSEIWGVCDRLIKEAALTTDSKAPRLVVVDKAKFRRQLVMLFREYYYVYLAPKHLDEIMSHIEERTTFTTVQEPDVVCYTYQIKHYIEEALGVEGIDVDLCMEKLREIESGNKEKIEALKKDLADWYRGTYIQGLTAEGELDKILTKHFGGKENKND